MKKKSIGFDNDYDRDHYHLDHDENSNYPFHVNTIPDNRRPGHQHWHQHSREERLDNQEHLACSEGSGKTLESPAWVWLTGNIIEHQPNDDIRLTSIDNDTVDNRISCIHRTFRLKSLMKKFNNFALVVVVMVNIQM
ncbi:hypothetical protein QR98_0094600 [Sarcoptes scabiei]|uniref:Uncharacterized protein n=1 Tax=Sarcoptes scabiei TaxID=52283 RepID=A0A132AK03_SARSC|nr:hypothetical protein QR98_0094600 [Sarcoptes scabiei]